MEYTVSSFVRLTNEKQERRSDSGLDDRNCIQHILTMQDSTIGLSGKRWLHRSRRDPLSPKINKFLRGGQVVGGEGRMRECLCCVL
jgi:hypothetical protein